MRTKIFLNEDGHIVIDMDMASYKELVKMLREMGNTALYIAQVLSIAFMKLSNVKDINEDLEDGDAKLEELDEKIKADRAKA